VHDPEFGYKMGVYLCLGQPIHNLKHHDSLHIDNFKTYEDIHQYMCENGKVLVFLGEGTHKIKKKAEQIACEEAIHVLTSF